MAFTYGSVTKCKVGSGATRNEYECRFGYQVNSQSIENNSSNITLRLQVRSISSSYGTYGYNQTSKIDGTTLSAKSFDMRSTNTWQTFGERTINVTHNVNGTYSASKSGSFTTTATGTYSLKSGSASVTVAPATIPRASQPSVSASSVNMGSSVTINTNRVSSSFTHTIEYSFNGASGTIATGVGDSTTWTPSLNLANQIPSLTSGNCTITCKTYNGSTLIGTKTVSLTLNVPSSVVPSINSVTVSEGNSTVSSKGWGVYVQNKSQLKVVTSASGSYGSTINSYKITGIDGNTYYSNNFTSNTLTQTGTKTITITVTDSRGRTATTTRTYNCIAYSNPSITSASAVRCNSDGTANESGNYVKYTFVANISSVSNHNSHVYKVGYKESSLGSYTFITLSDNTYSLNKQNVIISGVTFDVDKSYDIQFYVQDAFSTTTKNASIPTGFTLMNWNASGKAMAIGKVSEASGDEKLFELGMESLMSQSSGDTYYRAKRSDTGKQVGFGVGSGGQNRGIWDYSANLWMTHMDQNNKLHFLNDKVSVESNGRLGVSGSIGLESDNGINFNNRGSISSNNYSDIVIHSGSWTYINPGDKTFTFRGDGTAWSPLGQFAAQKEKSIVTTDNGSKSYIVLGDLLICWGKVSITPSAANTPTGVWVTFPKAFASLPAILTSAHSGVPGTQVTGTSATDPATTGFTAYLTRTNTGTTAVYWVAIGQTS